MNNYDLIIIGAGAAGLTAAIAFLRGGSDAGKRGSVLLIDANGEPGKKLLATGNGRCNLSNASASGWRDTKEFFESLGLLLYEGEGGRVYPQSRQAATVRNALVGEAVRLGAEFLANVRATGVSRSGAGFVVEAERNGEVGALSGGARRAKPSVQASREAPMGFSSEQVIVATGGKACPAYGNFGDGYAIARSFGIEVSPIRPALAPFVYADDVKGGLAALAGVRAKARVELLMRRNGNGGGQRSSECGVIASAEGEVQFAAYGLSGICVFDLSRHYTGGDGCAVRIDLAPRHTEREIAELLASDRAAGLAGIVNSKIAEHIEAKASDAETAAVLVKRLTVPVKGTKGWKDAQITAGGVSMGEVAPGSYEAAKASGLYFVGEALDYDGASGGYNLDFAWNSGLKAGRAAAKHLTK